VTAAAATTAAIISGVASPPMTHSAGRSLAADIPMPLRRQGLPPHPEQRQRADHLDAADDGAMTPSAYPAPAQRRVHQHVLVGYGGVREGFKCDRNSSWSCSLLVRFSTTWVCRWWNVAWGSWTGRIASAGRRRANRRRNVRPMRRENLRWPPRARPTIPAPCWRAGSRPTPRCWNRMHSCKTYSCAWTRSSMTWPTSAGGREGLGWSRPRSGRSRVSRRASTPPSCGCCTTWRRATTLSRGYGPASAVRRPSCAATAPTPPARPGTQPLPGSSAVRAPTWLRSAPPTPQVRSAVLTWTSPCAPTRSWGRLPGTL
jgi:hypothetical protein